MRLRSWFLPNMLVAALTSILGCGKSLPETGEVTGVVKLESKPLPEVSVLFTPDTAQGFSGPSSGAITDGEGRYKLFYSLPNDGDLASPTVGTGGLIGWHVVTISDFKMMNELLPPPGRVPAKYTDTSTSPLRFEVVEGTQTIDILLDP